MTKGTVFNTVNIADCCDDDDDEDGDDDADKTGAVDDVAACLDTNCADFFDFDFANAVVSSLLAASLVADLLFSLDVLFLPPPTTEQF
jgi:hypothetical protein